MFNINTQRYSLPAGSRLIFLPDHSGVAIYNGYNSDTTFLVNKSNQALLSDFPDLSSGFTQSDLMKNLNLSAESAKSLIERLITEKVLWTDNNK
ncbi:hypothetical protein [Alteromonas sp. M12]|uniref:hypothetical protein n=1 Tax=Alteromonas sp. M12 TaxID=3135644 RepID=UPI00319E5BD7